jgi:peptide chain release factor 3
MTTTLEKGSISTAAVNGDFNSRRTFAIISHPDAGKTTLTEKLLLYGNAIELAGNVRARRNQRNTTSDWMEMERQRGISISSTVLQFPYQDRVISLLDTPGHQDFSEDTYRTLAAVDSAVMVLDAAKGIEPQTRKLFDVCRKRGLPLFTFINKMDRPSRDPLELLDEIENLLSMQAVPLNWPLGDGPDFQGVYDRMAGGVYLYERSIRNERISLEKFIPLEKLPSSGILTNTKLDKLMTEIEMLDGLGIEFDHSLVLAGQQTPVFFGSALTNFGVRLFLDAFIEYAPHPAPFASTNGLIYPDYPEFTGFIFKIQANMNPKHRDSVAFLRICSGRFVRGLSALHPRSGKIIRLQRPYKLFANEREVVDEAYPGEIIGIPNNGEFAIGDTLCTGQPVEFSPIPRFQPEHFAELHLKDISKQKQFYKGLHQLETEGAVQVLFNANAMKRAPILAVVGMLQFDVVQARLENEYNAKTRLEILPFTLARWLEGPPEVIESLPIRNDVLLAHDSRERLMMLFSSDFYVRYISEKYPQLHFESLG